MADHAKPILTDNYTDVLSQIRGRFEDQAKGFDPANTTATNISTGTIRWNSAEKKFQKWSGTAWGDLTDNYVLSGATFSTGTVNGVAYLNGSKVLTTGSALTFDGTTLQASTASGGHFHLNSTVTGTVNTIISLLNNGNAYADIRYNALTHQWLIGTELMRLTSTGLGIGTSSPLAKLDVHAPANGLLANFMESTSGNTRRIRLLNNGNVNTIESTTGVGSTNLAFAVDGNERMRLDYAGNLGLGVTPRAWGGTDTRAIDINSQFGVFNSTTSNGTMGLLFNGYYNAGSYLAKISGAYSGSYEYSAGTGRHTWKVAGLSGAVGSAISFTQAMTLDANGNLLVGNTNGTSRITASGVIESTTGGFKFPDGTTQTTAGINPATAAAGAIGTMAMCKYTGTGSVSFGGTKNASELQYSDVTGSVVTATVDGNTWRCLGRCSDTGNTQRVTIWVRVS